MPWGRMDDQMHNSTKLATFSDKAYRLWVNSISYCNEKRTRDPEGHLSPGDVLVVCRLSGATEDEVAELTAKRGWDRDGEGYVVHDFWQYGPRPDRTAPARMRAYRARQRHAAVAAVDAVETDGAPAQEPASEAPLRRNAPHRYGVTPGGYGVTEGYAVTTGVAPHEYKNHVPPYPGGNGVTVTNSVTVTDPLRRNGGAEKLPEPVSERGIPLRRNGDPTYPDWMRTYRPGQAIDAPSAFDLEPPARGGPPEHIPVPERPRLRLADLAAELRAPRTATPEATAEVADAAG